MKAGLSQQRSDAPGLLSGSCPAIVRDRECGHALQALQFVSTRLYLHLRAQDYLRQDLWCQFKVSHLLCFRQLRFQLAALLETGLISRQCLRLFDSSETVHRRGRPRIFWPSDMLQCLP